MSEQQIDASLESASDQPSEPIASSSHIKTERLNEILRKLMNELHVSEAELARKTGIPQPTLHRILSGATKSPRGVSLAPLANFFSVTINQLLGEDPLPLDRLMGTQSLRPRSWTPVPLISWQDASQWPNLEGNESPTRWTSTDAPVSPNVFALRVKGESISPRFPEGALLIIDPLVAPMDRDFVVTILNGQNVVVFKQFLIDGPDLYLKPLNEDYRTVPFTSEYRLIGTVVQVRIDFHDR